MSNVKELEAMANRLRIHSLKSTTTAGSGHPTSCLSCAEVMSSLFFSELKEDDEFILSKGHAAPILWAAYAEAGLIPKEELMNLRKITSNLEGHPTARMPLVKIATGSLGQGLSAGVGMALAKRLDNNDNKNNGRIYVLMGDGETAEGSVWEAANSAAHYKLNNLCAIVDVNRLGQSQPTMHAHEINVYKEKFEAFGWNALVVNGHKISELVHAFEKAKKNDKPTVILAKTFKGKGVSFLEDKEGWHGKTLNDEELKKALEEITDTPKLTDAPGLAQFNLHSCVKEKKHEFIFAEYETNKCNIGEMISTREAFGKALVNLGRKNSKAVSIDGDVKNSTMTNYFFNEFPERSFEMFIAEQDMLGAAMGFSSLGYLPFVATFGAFLARAHDFIRMAQYSNSNIKIIGSHAGVSIGEDGPSQMALEDLSMFISMPHATVLYPCDAVSTEKLVREMAKHKGIVYLRTTREKTPVLYNNDEKFPLGGLKVLKHGKKDKALVIAAGITVHEALKAYELLKKKKIEVRVIDLYSVKPIDENELLKNSHECKGNIIVVEDHYANGIGSAVAEVLGKIRHLYIKDIPHSGKPEELRAKYSIDATAIVKEVEKIK